VKKKSASEIHSPSMLQPLTLAAEAHLAEGLTLK